MVNYDSGVRVNLGCGHRKIQGFIGVDRFPLDGVDVVADMDRRLPFDDDSVDVVYASHSLEHVSSLKHTMSELYRVCKDKALVIVLAPYSATLGNAANFYHKFAFNENTFRFFTNASEFYIDPDIVKTPSIPDRWGLSASDNSENNEDFRTIYEECTYYYEYQGLPPEQLNIYRKSLSNVCEMILYYLVVVKNNSLSQSDASRLKVICDEILVQTGARELLNYYQAQPKLTGFPSMLDTKLNREEFGTLLEPYITRLQTQSDMLEKKADKQLSDLFRFTEMLSLSLGGQLGHWLMKQFGDRWLQVLQQNRFRRISPLLRSAFPETSFTISLNSEKKRMLCFFVAANQKTELRVTIMTHGIDTQRSMRFDISVAMQIIELSLTEKGRLSITIACDTPSVMLVYLSKHKIAYSLFDAEGCPNGEAE